jgi:hypothetical protein
VERLRRAGDGLIGRAAALSERTTVKSIWRFILFHRWLVLDWLLIITAVRYLYVALPKSPVPAAPQRPSLAAKFQKIENGMIEEEVVQILGTPQIRREYITMDLLVMEWTDEQDRIVIIFLWSDTGTVLQKQLFVRGSARSST